MSWPSDGLSVEHFDAETDRPSDAWSMLKLLTDRPGQGADRSPWNRGRCL